MNKTMKKLEKMYPITADSPEGKEIKELFDGMGMDMTDNNVMLAVYAYMLGQASKKGAA